MVFVKYVYKGKKAEIQKLLRKRLDYKQTIRYHNSKIKDFEKKLIEVENELDKILK